MEKMKKAFEGLGYLHSLALDHEEADVRAPEIAQAYQGVKEGLEPMLEEYRSGAERVVASWPKWMRDFRITKHCKGSLDGELDAKNTINDSAKVSIPGGWTVRNNGEYFSLQSEDGSGVAIKDADGESLESRIVARFLRDFMNCIVPQPSDVTLTVDVHKAAHDSLLGGLPADQNQETKYTIEPHGGEYALYYGRSVNSHGLNLCRISEVAYNCDLKTLEDRLNKPDLPVVPEGLKLLLEEHIALLGESAFSPEAKQSRIDETKAYLSLFGCEGEGHNG